MAISERKSQYAKALMELRSLLMSGDLEPGERLSEVGLSKRIGISRTPLREAMTRLVEEGLLERVPTGGCRVRSFRMEDILDAIELRGVVEGTGLRLAAERGACPKDLAACRDLLDSIDRALGPSERETDFHLYSDLNARFHNMLSELCRSQIVAREFDRVTRLPLAAPSAFLKGQIGLDAVRRSLFTAQAHHRAMVEAIERREGARAEALAREHARLAGANLEYVMGVERGLSQSIPGMSLVSGA